FDVKSAVQRAEDAAQMRVSTWKDEIVPGFFQKHAEFKESRGLYAALDAEVRHLQEQAMKAGKDHLAPAILEKAAAKVRADFGMTGAEEAGQKPKPKSNARAEAEK